MGFLKHPGGVRNIFIVFLVHVMDICGFEELLQQLLLFV
jgi:hypothetical protein